MNKEAYVSREDALAALTELLRGIEGGLSEDERSDLAATLRSQFPAGASSEILDELQYLREKYDDMRHNPHRVTMWSPIASAPTDGTYIILWSESLRHPCVAHFESGGWSTISGWFPPKVTHWMRVPKEPKP